MKNKSLPPKVLLTGASGYLGSHIARSLEQCGWTVGILVRPNGGRRTRPFSKHEEVFFYTGTYESIHKCLLTFRPSVVIHLASLFLVRHEAKDIEDLVGSNILFGTQLLEAMSDVGVKFIVNAGTSWQHYQSATYDPVNLYAATKQAFEDILLYYTEARGIESATLKLFDTYGPEDARPKLLNLLLQTLRTGETLDMSPGNQIVDFTHVQDVACAFKLAAEGLMNGTISSSSSFAIRGGTPVTLRELVSMIERISGERLQVQFGALPYRSREVMKLWDGEILRGWVPVVSLEDGLRQLLANNKMSADKNIIT